MDTVQTGTANSSFCILLMEPVCQNVNKYRLKYVIKLKATDNMSQKMGGVVRGAHSVNNNTTLNLIKFTPQTKQ